jgi:hypothetical protein
MKYMAERITKTLGIIALMGLSGLLNAQSMNWSLAGPVYNAGRARNMVVDRSNPQVLYVGSASSGVFQSLDGGSNWTPTDDQGAIKNISYLAQGKDGTVYAATGEGFLSRGQKSKARPGTGLYKLNSLGQLVLVQSSAVTGTVINRVACDPNSSGHIALATNLGILVSIDGTNFTNVTSQFGTVPTGTAVMGQDVKFDGNGILYCSIGSAIYTGTALTGSQVYRSTNNSMNAFTNITPTLSSLPNANYGRIELAVAPSNNNVVYVSCANWFMDSDDSHDNSNSASLNALFVTYQASNTSAADYWGLVLQGSAQLDPLSFNGSFAFGDYAHVITVDPSDPDLLYFGGVRFYSFKRQGGPDASPTGTWKQWGQFFFLGSPDYLHENIHDIQIINSGSSKKYFFVTDAGIFRSLDFEPTNTNSSYKPSFQPFYKGLVTGQYNSVSIERYPIGSGTGNTQLGSQVIPYSGFVGGTGGNGLSYFSGNNGLVSSEIAWIGGEFYNTEYSKILSDAVLSTRGNGSFYRSANIKNSAPTLAKINKYSGVLSKIAPTPENFSNPSYTTTGTSFKLWENYGQLPNSPDSIWFYNDTIRSAASVGSVAELTTTSTFTFQAIRPSKFAQIDSIAIKTGTVQQPVTGSNANSPQFKEGQDINFKLNPQVANTSTLTVYTNTNIINTTGPLSSTKDPTVTLNNLTLNDNISVTFAVPPFITKTVTSTTIDHSQYYRVWATIYYKYKTGDEVSVIDDNISTKTHTYTTILTRPLNWQFGTLPTATTLVASTTNSANLTPTYVLNPGNSPQGGPTSQSSPSFAVNPVTTTNYTLTHYGDYAISAKQVVYTLKAAPMPTTMATGTSTYILTPGNVSTVIPSPTTIPSFTVIPSTTVASTDYTITQYNGTLTSDTYSTILATSYSINTVAGTQSSPVFTVTVLPNAPTPTVTLSGISSNTASGANTSTNVVVQPIKNTFTIGGSSVPFAKNNPTIKIKMLRSARLAMIMNNGSVSSNYAIMVSKNPLALNDPLNFVRVSQTKAYKDDPNGAPTTSVMTFTGKPTLLQWSTNGTEIYFATSDNKLYRVSHINEIMDLSKSSYSGKFYTDIFKYASPINDAANNPASPYRTTLIGSFDRPITSINVSNNDSLLVITFNGAATGTTGIVMCNTKHARKCDDSNIGWVNKEGGAFTNMNTYCSLMEKDNNKEIFVGTDNGVYYTSDVTSANWSNVNNGQLPNVQIFDIEQQTMAPWDCYNSGQIYVATYGRGVWVNNKYLQYYTVGTEEYEKAAVTESNLRMYPNPTNSNVTLLFKGMEGENAVVNVSDLSGRVVKTINLGKLDSSDASYSFETSDLSSGIYIVNINGDSGAKRAGKLVVTK